jgi:hypothetical protein
MMPSDAFGGGENREERKRRIGPLEGASDGGVRGSTGPLRMELVASGGAWWAFRGGIPCPRRFD